MVSPSDLFSGMGVVDSTNPQTRFKAVLLLGPPGSGKGVQGNILKSIPGFYHFSSGEVFRRLDMATPIGKVFLEYSARGELVPDDLVIQVWLANINAHAVLGDFKPARHLLVLDGIPRTVHQAEMLEHYLDVLAVIHLKCGDLEAMVDRLRSRALKENRPDDADVKVIRNRFAVYDKETTPILAFYPNEKLVNVDCLGSPARVAAQVLGVLAPLQDQHTARGPL
jgi:adenylate kinase